MDANIVISIFIVLLTVLSCLFSGNETSVTSVKPYQWLARTNNTNTTRTKCVIKILNNYSFTIGSILIGNTLSNIICSSLLTLLVENNFGNIYVALATGILSIFVLLFCEYIPKTWARTHAIVWIKAFWWLIIFFYILFWPICWVFNRLFYREKEVTVVKKTLIIWLELFKKKEFLNKMKQYW